ncbi:hypothetical protein Pcinc_023303 [Petrolisthes cinctipes]|uniref:Uncharacterized protein n=1 Tax=Petrolisthes cinctipes TaxID=88211 RepID=A0AAE1FFR8_PETCI|nr:hypothetical protein Pcinc_023303 [Petrolisthes cinctipes]
MPGRKWMKDWICEEDTVDDYGGVVQIQEEIIADSLAQEACRIHPWQCWLAEHLGLAFLAPVPPTLIPPQGQNIPLFAPLIKAAWPLVQLGQLWWNGIPLTPLPHELPFLVMKALGCGAAAAFLHWLLFH